MTFEKPNPEYVANRESAKDGMRNAIAQITARSEDEAFSEVCRRLDDAGVSYEVVNELRGSHYVEHRVFFPSETARYYRDRGARGFFVEAAITGREGHRDVVSKDTFIVWIFFNVKGTELTAMRREFLPYFGL